MAVKMEKQIVLIHVWAIVFAGLDMMFVKFFVIEQGLSTDWAFVAGHVQSQVKE